MTVELRDQEFPAFYAEAPVVASVYDPLARFLGAARQGLIEYRYADVVRLAGHSCPTVAGAYLMALHGLRALYGTETPVCVDVEGLHARCAGQWRDRGHRLGRAAGHGCRWGNRVSGCGKWIFFARKNLLAFGADVDGVLGMRRRDTGKAVMVHFDNAVVPWPDAMPPLMAKALGEQASSDELEQFARLWQERVRCMLVDHADNPALVRVTEWHPAL